MIGHVLFVAALRASLKRRNRTESLSISDAKLEQLISFTAETPGDNQTIDFLLYQEGQTTAYKSLRLWVDIEE